MREGERRESGERLSSSRRNQRRGEVETEGDSAADRRNPSNRQRLRRPTGGGGPTFCSRENKDYCVTKSGNYIRVGLEGPHFVHVKGEDLTWAHTSNQTGLYIYIAWTAKEFLQCVMRSLLLGTGDRGEHNTNSTQSHGDRNLWRLVKRLHPRHWRERSFRGSHNSTRGIYFSQEL